jgi:hypothetical protein
VTARRRKPAPSSNSAPAPSLPHIQLDLSRVRRRSRCCHFPIRHPFPANKRFSKALLLVCCSCGRDAGHFEVIDRAGTVIWPVPREFVVPESRKGNDLGKLYL